MSEILSMISPSSYFARSSVHDIKNIIRTKKAIQKAFKHPLDGKGMGLVEILSSCPTNWKMDPVACNKRIKEEVVKNFPLGEFINGRREI
jgi:2-oxoglutarate ferredoxin oxidoreductase subunit beta